METSGTIAPGFGLQRTGISGPVVLVQPVGQLVDRVVNRLQLFGEDTRELRAWPHLGRIELGPAQLVGDPCVEGLGQTP